jgi:hypothetical protein
LPVVWPSKSYGDFGSGGLPLANVAFEFVTEKGESTVPSAKCVDRATRLQRGE